MFLAVFMFLNFFRYKKTYLYFSSPY